MAIFQLLKKEQKSLLNYYTSIKLWFLFQTNSINEVFGWNRNRFSFIVPIPVKHPVYIHIYIYFILFCLIFGFFPILRASEAPYPWPSNPWFLVKRKETSEKSKDFLSADPQNPWKRRQKRTKKQEFLARREKIKEIPKTRKGRSGKSTLGSTFRSTPNLPSHSQEQLRDHPDFPEHPRKHFPEHFQGFPIQSKRTKKGIHKRGISMKRPKFP